MSDSSEAKTDRSLSLIVLFAGTLFVSASLMFVLQPLFGKLCYRYWAALRRYGIPVWCFTKASCFSVIFMRIRFPRVSTSAPNPDSCRRYANQLSGLAVALPENIAPPTDANPTFWLFWTLFLAIGLPFSWFQPQRPWYKNGLPMSATIPAMILIISMPPATPAV